MVFLHSTVRLQTWRHSISLSLQFWSERKKNESNARSDIWLGNSGRCNFLKVFHAPFFQELEDWRRLWTDRDVGHQRKVLYQSNSTTLHNHYQPVPTEWVSRALTTTLSIAGTGNPSQSFTCHMRSHTTAAATSTTTTLTIQDVE